MVLSSFFWFLGPGTANGLKNMFLCFLMLFFGVFGALFGFFVFFVFSRFFGFGGLGPPMVRKTCFFHRVFFVVLGAASLVSLVFLVFSRFFVFWGLGPPMVRKTCFFVFFWVSRVFLVVLGAASLVSLFFVFSRGFSVFGEGRVWGSGLDLFSHGFCVFLGGPSSNRNLKGKRRFQSLDRIYLESN